MATEGGRYQTWLRAPFSLFAFCSSGFIPLQFFLRLLARETAEQPIWRDKPAAAKPSLSLCVSCI
jgi:hypothetical protein